MEKVKKGKGESIMPIEEKETVVGQYSEKKIARRAVDKKDRNNKFRRRNNDFNFH